MFWMNDLNSACAEMNAAASMKHPKFLSFKCNLHMQSTLAMNLPIHIHRVIDANHGDLVQEEEAWRRKNVFIVFPTG